MEEEHSQARSALDDLELSPVGSPSVDVTRHGSQEQREGTLLEPSSTASTDQLRVEDTSQVGDRDTRPLRLVPGSAVKETKLPHERSLSTSDKRMLILNRSTGNGTAAADLSSTAEPSPELQQRSLDAHDSSNPCLNTSLTSLPGSQRISSKLSKYQRDLCATLLLDAQLARASMIREDCEDPTRLALYHIYVSWPQRLILAIVLLVQLCLPLFERPNDDLTLELPLAATMAIELVCVLFHIARLIQQRLITGGVDLWNDRKTQVMVFIITATLIDMLAFAITSSIGVWNIRWTRVLRPLFLVSVRDYRQVRQGFRAIRLALVKLLPALITLLSIIAIFALIMVQIFSSRNVILDQYGNEYMRNYWDTFFDLYVLTTSANFPDIMIPAYSRSRAYAILFIVFIIICMYIFLGVILAIVYEEYRLNIKREMTNLLRAQQRNLARIFNVIQEDGAVSREAWCGFIRHMMPKLHADRADIMFDVIDANDDDAVDIHEFLDTVSVLEIPIEPQYPPPNVFDRLCPRFYNSSISQTLRHYITSKWFDYFFDAVIVLNFVLLALIDGAIEPYFLSLYLAEIVCRMYAAGIFRYFYSLWNVFDFVIVVGALAILLYDVSTEDKIEKTGLLEIVLILRSLRLVKLLRTIPSFSVVVDTIGRLGPAMLTYGVMIVVVYYAFAIVGMELFAGRIYEGNSKLNGSVFEPGSPFYEDIHRGNPKLNGTTFAREGYFFNNFNDIVSSFIVLFELMVVNQWHIIVSGYVILTSKAARIYFVLFHMSSVIIIMNIFIAFVLDAFLLEKAQSTRSEEDEDELRLRYRRLLSQKSIGGVPHILIPRPKKTAMTIYFEMFRDELMHRRKAMSFLDLTS